MAVVVMDVPAEVPIARAQWAHSPTRPAVISARLQSVTSDDLFSPFSRTIDFTFYFLSVGASIAGERGPMVDPLVLRDRSPQLKQADSANTFGGAGSPRRFAPIILLMTAPI